MVRLDIVFSFPLLLGFFVCIHCKNIQLRQRQAMFGLVRLCSVTHVRL